MSAALEYRHPPWSDDTYFDDGTGWAEDLVATEEQMTAAEIKQKLMASLAEARAAAEEEIAQLHSLLEEIDRMEAALNETEEPSAA